MIAGIGVDLVDLDHMASVCQKQPQIYKKILTEKGVKSIKSIVRNGSWLFSRSICSKEAFSKALGTGIGKTVTFQNISIPNDERAADCCASPFKGNVFVSISHLKKAVAQVILEKYSNET